VTNAAIDTPDREAIRLQESPLTTVYVAPGHGTLDGPTAVAISVTGTMPMANITMAKSQRLRVDDVRVPAPSTCSDTCCIRYSLRYLWYRHPAHLA
jgi:hypothetical protein